ncbi:hypothetical protein [Nitrosospira sp. NpAV]|uniref:hypothetical protein n=1 Tax=Nitrosospira sp. NpAV TaxID=58133 RepID=UPI00059FF891|nr:hypothetical protein [Nitrosospira sp. NpAV]KIO50411.1 hypothetical protein SQ11_01715 [Nitrosospira sp. NpAV]
MKQNSILRSPAMQSAALAGIMILTMAGVPHAQTGAAGHDGASIPGQGVSTATQPSSRQKDAASDQESSPQKKGSAAPEQHTPDQSGSPASSLPSNQEPGWGESPAPEPESLFRKIIRIFFGPDSPPGPNPDVDTNISAGGAAGG